MKLLRCTDPFCELDRLTESAFGTTTSPRIMAMYARLR
jgi:hypothetical protein